MQTPRLLALVLTLSLALLVVTAPAAPRLVTPSSAVPGAVQPGFRAPAAQSVDTRDEFMKKLRDYAKISARDEIAGLVRRNEAFAVDSIRITCEAIANGANERLEEEIALLRQGWRDGMKTGFADKLYEYYSLLQLDSRQRADHGRVRSRYDKANEAYNDALEGDSRKAFLPVGEQFQSLGDAFEQVGDLFMASTSWIQAGICVDTPQAEEFEDLSLAVFRYQKGIDLREKVELKDKIYTDTRSRTKQLYGLGYGQDPEAKPAPTTPGEGGTDDPAGGAAAIAGPVAVAMTFEPLEGIGKTPRPTYFGDEIYEVWNSIDLGRVGSTTTFPGMADSPTIVRSSASKAVLDLAEDAGGELQIPMTGNVEPITFEIGQGEQRRGWGFMARILGEDAVYQGVTVNMQADDNQMRIFYVPAGSVVGEVLGQRFQVVDDNMDGLYGSAPLSYAFAGMSDGHYQPMLDSVLVGKEKTARPWSKHQYIDGAWYEFEARKAGLELGYQPRKFPSGTIKLKTKGVKFDWLVIVGLNETFAETYIDLAPNGSKGTPVPAGTWKVYGGLVTKGKRRQLAKAVVLPSDSESASRITVRAGETTTVELGAPFGFDFRVQDEGDTATILGSTVVVTGVGGERYERPWNCVAQPEASLRAVGSKKGGKGKKFDIVNDQQAIYDLGWAAPFFPKDLTLDKKKAEDEVEAQLEQKKHKLFGSISSDWKN